jgi:hypothetical protein
MNRGFARQGGELVTGMVQYLAWLFTVLACSTSLFIMVFAVALAG